MSLFISDLLPSIRSILRWRHVRVSGGECIEFDRVRRLLSLWKFSRFRCLQLIPLPVLLLLSCAQEVAEVASQLTQHRLPRASRIP